MGLGGQAEEVDLEPMLRAAEVRECFCLKHFVRKELRLLECLEGAFFLGFFK